MAAASSGSFVQGTKRPRTSRAGHDAIDEASGSALGRESLHERHCLAEPVQLAPAIGAADEVRVQR